MAKTQSSPVAKPATKTTSPVAKTPRTTAAKKVAPAAKKTKPVPPKPARVVDRLVAVAVETVPAVVDVVDAVIVKPAKTHKPKLVRDSFTIPKDEYQVLDTLKGRALGLGQHVRKSELLRAGIQVLAAMGDRAFLKAVGSVPTLKTGRPKGD